MNSHKKTQSQSLAEELPYWDFFSTPLHHVVLNDSSIVCGFETEVLDIECLDDNEVNNFTVSLRNCLNSISEGSYLQFFLDVDSDYRELIKKHQSLRTKDIDPMISNIADLRDKILYEDIENKNLYKPKLKVFLRRKPGEFKKSSIFKSQEDFTMAGTQQYEELFETVSQDIESLKSSFDNLGLFTTDLKQEDLLRDIYRFFNPMRSQHQPAPRIQPAIDKNLNGPNHVEDWLVDPSPREQLVFGDLVLNVKQFTLDLFHHRVISLKTLPENTFAGQLNQFLRMPFHYSLLLSVHLPSQSSEMARLQQKRKMAHSLASTQPGSATDLESESKLSATEELIRELLNTGQKIFSVQMNILLKEEATTQGERILNHQVREVLSRFRALQGAEALGETVGAWKVLKGVFPLAPTRFERAKKMKTNNLCDFLPLYGPRKGDNKPVILFRNRLGGLISYDPFDPKLNNYNCLVTGSSGSGKSFLNNCILLQEMAQGLKVFVIDIGGFYKKLTKALDGQYIEIELSQKYRINPFHLSSIRKGPSDQKIKSLISMVEYMVTDSHEEKLDKFTKVQLEKEIIQLFDKKKTENKLPILSDLEQSLSTSDDEILRKISKMLFIWTGSRPYGKLLDGYGELDTKAKICSFDLKGLSRYPDLQSVMILTLTDFILSQIEEDKSVRKRIILDEAWELLKSQAAASFMEYCARTLRKTGSGITFITQGIEEIAHSPIGSAILNNTATKILMLQRGDIETLRRNLKLNHQEIELIQSLEQKKEFTQRVFSWKDLKARSFRFTQHPLNIGFQQVMLLITITWKPL